MPAVLAELGEPLIGCEDPLLILQLPGLEATQHMGMVQLRNHHPVLVFTDDHMVHRLFEALLEVLLESPILCPVLVNVGLPIGPARHAHELVVVGEDDFPFSFVSELQSLQLGVLILTFPPYEDVDLLAEGAVGQELSVGSEGNVVDGSIALQSLGEGEGEGCRVEVDHGYLPIVISHKQTLVVVTDGSGFCFVGGAEREVMHSLSIGFFLIVYQPNLAIQFDHQNPLAVIGDVHQFDCRFECGDAAPGLEVSPVVQEDGSGIGVRIPDHQNRVVLTDIASLAEETRDGQALAVEEGLAMKEASQTQERQEFVDLHGEFIIKSLEGTP